VEVKAMDRFTKACLVLIILLLAVIAVRPLVFPQNVAAQQRYTYIAVAVNNPYEPQPVLDKYAADGWELVSTYVVPYNNSIVIKLIFRK
jgi:hypothetical protein